MDGPMLQHTLARGLLVVALATLVGCAPPAAAPTGAPAAPTPVAKPTTVGASPASASPSAATVAPASSPAAIASAAASATAKPAVSPAAQASVGPSQSAIAASANQHPAMVAAANAFVASLNDSQRSQGVFEFSNTETKAQWSNLPRQLFQWAGVRMGDLTAEQQQLLKTLLQASLSQQGYDRVMASVAADEYLKSQSGANQLQFGADNYFVSVYGTPSTSAPWMF